jgi:hypothetical protein
LAIPMIVPGELGAEKIEREAPGMLLLVYKRHK